MEIILKEQEKVVDLEQNPGVLPTENQSNQYKSHCCLRVDFCYVNNLEITLKEQEKVVDLEQNPGILPTEDQNNEYKRH